ncbi:copper resistance protein CopC [Halalkalicoccus tibetensis]|uniref:Copper resistance protein CopC n=1 Tax=Halalkalicoccus tibetensis TaxID=175632 RepID=A0ABD5V523_9EURY
MKDDGTTTRSGVGVSRADPRWVRVALIGLVLCALLASAPLAGAHAYLNESEPGNGEAVEEVPEEVGLSFSGDGVQIAEVSVTGPDGEDVSGPAHVDPDDPRLVAAPIEEAGEGEREGIYVVEWEVLADDGHTTSGTFLFSVGDGPPDREQVIGLHEDDEEGVSGIEAAANGLVLLSLIGLVGVPVSLWIAIYPLAGRFGAPLGRAEERARTVLLASGAAMLAGVVGLGLARSASIAPSLSSSAVGRFLGTSLGALWIAQLVVAGAVVGVLLVARRRPLARRYWLGGAVAGGLAVQLSVSATSHSASLIDRFQGTATDFAHIGGAALWVGGLPALGLVLPAVLRRAEAERAVAAAAIRRFSVVVLTGVTLAVTTGLVLAAWHAPDPEGLWTTLYGTLLSAKTLLVVLALGLGGLTRAVLLRRLEDGRADVGSVVRAVRIEGGVLLAVVLVSGLLTAAPTAAVAGADGPSEATAESGNVELTVLPAEDGGSALLVDEDEPIVLDARFLADGEPVPAEEPTLLLRNDQSDVTLTTDLEETEGGVYSTVETLPAVGSWEVRVSGQVDDGYESEWFRLFNVPDHPAHDDHASEGTAFAAWLRIGALATGLLGTLAVLIETARFEQ